MKKEIIDFFMGLLASSETLMFARRIQIAQMIVNGLKIDEFLPPAGKTSILQQIIIN